jgi:hypothetical protein
MPGRKPQSLERRETMRYPSSGDPADRGIDGALYQGRVEALV